MSAVHDLGGRPNDEPIDRSEHVLADWGRKIDAMVSLIDAMVSLMTRKKLIRVDERRRAIESLPAERYESMAYYERWAHGLEQLMIEKGIVSAEEMEKKVGEVRTRYRDGTR